MDSLVVQDASGTVDVTRSCPGTSAELDTPHVVGMGAIRRYSRTALIGPHHLRGEPLPVVGYVEASLS